MARYFRAKYTNGFMKEKTVMVATGGCTPEEAESCKNLAFNTGFNGCKLVGYEEISEEEYRRGN